MKLIRIHPLMSVYALNIQFLKVLYCSVVVYKDMKPADPRDLLYTAGLQTESFIEVPLDLTMSIRDYEEYWEEQQGLLIELAYRDCIPYGNKSLKLYQLPVKCFLPESEI